MNWINDKIITLLESYKENECNWNSKCAKHKYRNIKANAKHVLQTI